MSSQDKKTIVVSRNTHSIIKMVSNMEKKTLEEITEELLFTALQQKVNDLKAKMEEVKEID